MSFSIIAIYLLLGIVAGILNSLIGLGGGIFIVPLTCWIMSITTAIDKEDIIKISITTSLFIMIINTANTIYRLHKKNRIEWKIGKKYIIPISLGSLSTYFLAQNIDGTLTKYLFIIYLITTIILNFKKKFLNPTLISAPSNLYICYFGALVGFISSFLGVGGSIITVPHFRKQGLKMERGVSLGVMLALPISILGFMAYFILGINVKIELELLFGFLYIPAILLLSIGGAIGVPLGMKIASKLPDSLYAKGYIVMLMLLCIIMTVSM